MTSAADDGGSSGGGSAGGGARSSGPTTRRHSRGSGGRTRGERVRLGLAAALGGLTVAFALLNLGRVDVDWILGTWNTPLIIVIAVSLFVGAVLGFALGRRRGRPASRSHSAAPAAGRGA